MKKGCRSFRMIAFLWLALLAFALPVHAKTLHAPKTKLKNVALAPETAGQWIQDGAKYYFQLPDGSLMKNEWISSGGSIYYLDSTGKRAKGWIKYRKKLYCVKKDTGLLRGWFVKGGKTYYSGETGAVCKGLAQIDGGDYFFSEKSGAAQSGWIKIGKHQYYFEPQTYRMKKSGWVKEGKKRYYVNKKGRKRKPGWLTVGEKKYYLDEDGARVTGEKYIDGEGYFFRKNGVYDPSVEVKFEVDPSKPMVALTFDDGPGAYTDRLLDCLEKNGAKATFFLVGSSVPQHPSAVKRMAQLGCEIGSHSYSHPQLSGLSDYAIAQEASKTRSVIRNACGQDPTVFRLPYGDGASNARVLRAVGLPSIYWSIDPRDWANTGNPQHTISEVLDNVKNGDIVLMHDIHYSSVVAAETIIPALIRRGYQLVTVSQLAEYKGKTTLKTGTTYRSF